MPATAKIYASLPQVSQSSLDIRPINKAGLPTEYLARGELEILVALMRSVRPKAILEIGVNTGRTAKAILDNIPGIETYQGIDVLSGYRPILDIQISERPDNPGELVKSDPRFELILRPNGSLDLAPWELKSCDAIFIDGDHGDSAVYYDTQLAHRLVRPGGIIIWHDYNSSFIDDVYNVLNEMYLVGKPIYHVENTLIAFERIS